MWLSKCDEHNRKLADHRAYDEQANYGCAKLQVPVRCRVETLTSKNHRTLLVPPDGVMIWIGVLNSDAALDNRQVAQSGSPLVAASYACIIL
jgi:hypothetical protein